MRIMSRSQGDLFKHILHLANGDMALTEDALRHVANFSEQHQVDVEHTYEELLKYLFTKMQKNEIHKQYLPRLLKELNEKQLENKYLNVKTA
jgi:hypothetical protein